MMSRFLKRIFARVVHKLARNLPGATTVRPLLHRIRGVKIHGKIFIGDEAYIENEYPECVEIHDGAQIGIRCIVLAHLRGPGQVVIEKRAFIGPNCVVSCAAGNKLTIGEGSVIAASSVVTSDVPPFTFVSSGRAKPIAHVGVPFSIETTYDEFIAGLSPLRKSGGNRRK